METKVKNIAHNIEIESNDVMLDGKNVTIDILRTTGDRISMIREGKQTSATICSINQEEKIVTLEINQELYEVSIKGKLEMLLSELGMNDMLVKKISDLTSPMPGLVLNIPVESGQEVKQGDVLLILEAMKMENSLKADAEGVVNEIKVKAGQSVEKGTTLITFK